MKMHPISKLFLAACASAGMVLSASAAIITVNTIDNTDFSAGKTNLYLALSLANTNGESSNTINFDVPGAGPHYIVTPQFAMPGGLVDLSGGYPLITNNNLTINGYSQPGSQANTNTILGTNSAILKIVIDSRQSNYTTDGDHPFQIGGSSMLYNLFPDCKGLPFVANQFGYGSNDIAQIGIFRATNVVIKGLCFLNDANPAVTPTIAGSRIALDSIALAVDPPTNAYAGNGFPQLGLQVSGCWFNLMPDGETVIEGGDNAVSTRWHRISGSNPASRWSPGGSSVGLAKNSATPQADQNIFMNYGQPVSLHGWTNRVSGNRFNVFPDGMHQYFPDPLNGDPVTYVSTTAFIGGVRDGRAVYGTDGDGVNDAEERNLFAGLPRQRSVTAAAIDQQLGGFDLRISGNYFGMAADGVTHFTNSCSFLRISDRPTPATNVVVGSDFNGVSDNLEGNVICNNWPLDFWFNSPSTQPSLDAQGTVPWNMPGAVPDVYNPDAQSARSTVCWRGNKMINNLPLYSPVYTAPNRAAPYGGFVYNWTAVLFALDMNSLTYAPQILGSMVYTDPGGDYKTITNRPDYGLVCATNYIPTLTGSTTRRFKGIFPGGFISTGTANRWTNYVMDIYTANEEGLTNGLKFWTLTNTMPAGWVQGETCVASNILVDYTDDLDPTTKQFDVDISALKLTPGTKLTCAISYSNRGITNFATATANGFMTGKFALPVTVQPSTDITITSISQSGGNVTITWSGGDPTYVVEKTTNINSGIWTRVTTTTSASATFAPSSDQEFYRIR